MPEAAIQVRGLRELQRAFKLADAALAKELKVKLREAAEPVRADAERLARARITRIGVPWSQMRVGVTQSVVYVAPKQRGAKSRANPSLRRPNLFDLLFGRSMQPALDANQAQIAQRVENVLDTVGKAWESA